MKALSIQQPWAWAILHAGKDVENRTRDTSYRGRIVIHVGKKLDTTSVQLLAEMGLTVPDGLPLGALVGEVNIVGVVRPGKPGLESNPWAVPQLHKWLLSNPVAYPNPVPWRGQLGFWDVPEEVVVKCRAG